MSLRQVFTAAVAMLGLFFLLLLSRLGPLSSATPLRGAFQSALQPQVESAGARADFSLPVEALMETFNITIDKITEDPWVTAKQIVTPTHAMVLSIVMIVVGPFFVLFGYRLYRYAIAVVGFLVGSYFTLLALYKTGSELNPTWRAVISAAVGAVCALIMNCIVQIGMFSLGAVAGGLGGDLLYQLVCDIGKLPNHSEPLQIGLIAGGAVLGGALAVWLFQVMVAVVTSFLGGYMVACSIDHFGYAAGAWHYSIDPFGPMFDNADVFVCQASCISLLVLWAGLFAFGTWWQTRSMTKL
eukprot:g69226.t1